MTPPAHLLLLLHLLLLSLLPPRYSTALPLSACKPLPLLVVFGDSLLDVGQNAQVVPLRSTSEFPPFGVDYFHRPAARYSNGRVVTDFLSQGLGYGLLDPSLNSVDPNFVHGVNFASSGSTAGNSTCTVLGNGSGFSFSVQIDQYKSFKTKVLLAQSKSNGSLTNLPSASALSHAIHIVGTAHNDYKQIAFLTPDFDPLSAVLTIISAMENGIRELHSAGAKNMIIMNLFPLGCTPGLLTVGAGLGMTLNEDGCLSAWTDLVDLHNTHLEKLLSQLREELSLKGLVLFDVNAIYMDGIRNPYKYGVAYPFEACCGIYNGTSFIGCGESGMLNGTTLVELGRCEEPSLYISWDGLHPVESFAKHIADGALSGKFLKPEFLIANSCYAYL